MPFKDHQALAREINNLLDHPEERLAMRRAAYEYCRPMVMKAMGARYLELFSDSRPKRSHAADLATLGTLIRSVACIGWLIGGLASDFVDSPLAELELYRQALDRALRA